MVFDNSIRERLVKEAASQTNAGLSTKEVNKLYKRLGAKEGIKDPIKTITSWVNLSKQTDSCAPKKRKMRGDVIVDSRHLVYAMDILDDFPSIEYDQLGIILFKEFFVAYTSDQLRKAMEKEGYSANKKVQRIAKQADSAVGKIWKEKVCGNANVPGFEASTFCFVDQASFGDKEIRPDRGKSKKGVTPVNRMTLPISEAIGEENTRSSVLGLCTKGVIAVTVHETNTGDSMLHDVENSIIPAMINRGLTHLGLDNAMIHLKPQFTMLCEPHGIDLLFLPPYQAWFNPTEPVHSSAKKYLKKRNLRGTLRVNSDVIIDAYRNCMKNPQEESCNLFKHCGFPIQDWERR